MNTVYLLLGSNLNDRMDSLQKAKEGIASEIGRISKVSSIYESEPWGFFAENSFLNQVVKVETILNAGQVLETILKIETDLGRDRKVNGSYISRIIDIDILFYNDEIINEDKLTVPHPKIAERMFTLLPLSEINKHYVHPGLHKTIQELVAECHDNLQVYLYPSTLPA
jgi:2-amino-4-hydroxy-6-hydroxymethyldihydropteridine diphosphokinase